MALLKKIKTDVLIIGAGGAGLRAAIEAVNHGVKVLVITKEEMGGAHTSMAMGGINVALKAPATPKLHYQDTVNGGWKINNFKLAHIFAKEMPERIYDLEKYGVKFDRLPDGSFYTWAGGKQTAPLNLCAGDYTGREMMRGLVDEINRLKVPYLEDHFVTRIFKNKDRVCGALVLNLKNNRKTIVQAKSIVIATGGGGMIYLVNTNAPSNTGEGYAWAFDLGAQLVDMEMIQFHPTGIAHQEKKGRLVTEKVRGHGGILKNKDGERFMKRYQPKRMELAGRDEVTRAIYQEIKEGRGTKNNGVYLDITHWEKGKAKKIIPDVVEDHDEMGIDITKKMMEISPSMHHMMGGININEWGKTNIKGLYAIGEVTRNIHGANRLGGNSIAEGQVFGRRAGIKIAVDVKKRKFTTIPVSLIKKELKSLSNFQKRSKGVRPSIVVKKLQQLMWDKVGIVRDGAALISALTDIQNLKEESKLLFAKTKADLQKCLEIPEMLTTSEAIIVSAIMRKESRGAHYRSDFPKMLPRWQKNIMVQKSKTGEFKTKLIPVVK